MATVEMHHTEVCKNCFKSSLLGNSRLVLHGFETECHAGCKVDLCSIYSAALFIGE